MDIAILAAPIHRVISLYHRLEPGQNMMGDADPFDVGDPLWMLLQEDWGIFSEKLLNSGNASLLLQAIANVNWDKHDGVPVIDPNELYTREESLWHSPLANKWSEFCSQVKIVFATL